MPVFHVQIGMIHLRDTPLGENRGFLAMIAGQGFHAAVQCLSQTAIAGLARERRLLDTWTPP